MYPRIYVPEDVGAKIGRMGSIAPWVNIVGVMPIL